MIRLAQLVHFVLDQQEKSAACLVRCVSAEQSLMVLNTLYIYVHFNASSLIECYFFPGLKGESFKYMCTVLYSTSIIYIYNLLQPVREHMAASYTDM